MKRSHRIVLLLCLSLLLCVTCLSLFSVKASAAEVSPDAENEWFFLPFNELGDIVGQFDAVQGTYYGTGSGSTRFLQFEVGTTNSSVLPLLKSGNKYLIYGTVSLVSSNVTGSPSSISLYEFINDRTKPYQWSNNYLDKHVDYNRETYSISGIYSFTMSENIFLNTGGALVWEQTETINFNGRCSWSFYALDVTDSSESEVNQIIAAIQDQTGQIKDKIDEVLTPEGENNLGDAVDQITDQVQENLGALGFAHDTIENFIGLFNEEPPAPVINVPPLKMKINGVEHQFFNGYQYDFRSMENNGLSVLVGAVRTAGTLVLWWAFLQYCLKEFDQFFRR